MADTPPKPNTTQDFKNEVNDQLKAIQAQLESVKKDQIAQFTAQWLQAKSFLSNPVTSAQGALMTAQFSSKKVFSALAEQLPFYDEFKKLQHLDSAALIDGLEANISNSLSGIENTAKQQLENAAMAQAAALTHQATAIANQAVAVATQASSAAALEKAITSGADAAVVAQLQSAKDAADNLVDTANNAVTNAASAVLSSDSAVNTAKQALSAITGFMTTLTNISSGKSHSSVIRNTGSVDTSTTTATAVTTSTGTTAA